MSYLVVNRLTIAYLCHIQVMQQMKELNMSPKKRKTTADDHLWKDWPLEERITAVFVTLVNRLAFDLLFDRQILAEDYENWSQNLECAKNVKEEQLKQFTDQ